MRYDITFVGTSPQPELIWFIESNDSSLINDLSGLNRFNSRIYGIYPRNVDVFASSVGNGGRFSFTLEVPPQQVPEPTPGLLGVGVLGALSLLKRNKRLKNPV